MTGRRPDSPSFFYGWLPRLVSVSLVVAVVLVGLAAPWSSMARGGVGVVLPWLVILWGLAAGFAHALDFVPARPLPRLLLGPGPAWILLLGGLLWMLVLSGAPPGRPE
ncbi:hypothetical protein AN478_04855 [Thiohalorhabdus denitrificans]|uniref:Cyd operon protein YbgE (Cyd_oper_YbgE) n=1 Tax=Thiohalorhabdus denitrificans TaxID=381306 RepID=A0A0P9EFM7_9GAMM|nr:hypothetical protein [Thiohalorhabdus denitrificans]KPV41220.1 hypothetical protein AN478_04855 [Thiohalorhabdus denitrificans]SCY63795.1 hypothetical protein SAMN05661077_2780 [Thiohalorhabdus denitrificans]